MSINMDDEIARLAGLEILTPDQIMTESLKLVGFDLKRQQRASIITNIARFKAFFGASPADAANNWEDLQTTDIKDALMHKKEKDLFYLLMAFHFLFCYPTKYKAEGIFKVSVRTIYKWAWFFIGKLAALSGSKITWPEEWDTDAEGVPEFLLTVDGVHCRSFEPVHPTLPKNKKAFSHKFHQSDYANEVTLSIWENHVVYINGPLLAGKSDLEIFREGLKKEILKGKKVVANQGLLA
mmetsp:Transcript_8881/g.11820  ORF Transcript_8881/g.11820 Transcript_8881/m.11820 type:complete len:238 (+) Transcript_8881:67-780(+)